MKKNNTKQIHTCSNRKPSWWVCCCGIMLFLVILCIVGNFVSNEIAENTIFLETENVTLVKTYNLDEWQRDRFLQGDPRTFCFLETDNKTAVTCFSSDGIMLKENDEFLAYTTGRRVRGMRIYPTHNFQDNVRYEFYRVIKKKNAIGELAINIEFLGMIYTNLYFCKRISVSPDGKYVIMSANTVNSRSLGEFRNKEVLLIWKIGDNVVEKDIVDSKGNKIPIIIKTEEE